jgi:hypothetical protein
MENTQDHDIALYPLESFNTLLEHEIRRSHRYGQPLTLIEVAVEADPSTPQTQHSAEVFAINVLNLQVRDTDIPCKKGGEFLVLMPSTDLRGGRIACERLEKLFKVNHQTYDRVSFQLTAFIGMTATDGTKPIPGSKLIEEASAAMQHARDNRSVETVLFNEIA